MNDPFAMRPFFGYNAGDYMAHWLSMESKPNVKVPKIFHVNWFRKNTEGKFIWPGFGENCRVLEWIFRRCNGEDIAKETPIGLVPKEGSLNTEGLSGDIDMEELFRLPKDYWLKECSEIQKYFDEQIPQDLPEEIEEEVKALQDRLMRMN